MKKIKECDIYNNETEKGNEILNEIYDIFEETNKKIKKYKGLKIEMGALNNLPIDNIKITNHTELENGAMVNFVYEDENFICETGYLVIEDIKINNEWYNKIKEISIGAGDFEEAIYKGCKLYELV